jgi:Kef-type K+ transport system membrane component KefB
MFENMFSLDSVPEYAGRILAVTGSGSGIYGGTGPLTHAISLFFVQATLIIGLCRFLGLAKFYLKQPTVIFEIIGGILIGPSALMRNQWFRQAVFPPSSLPYLQIVATIGLTFYLFIVGIELDTKLLKTHFRKTTLISVAGITVPFCVGIAVSKTLFNVLQPESHATHTSFFVFIGTAMSITAFPVLARMLSEGGLIYTRPGSMALGAAAVDDAIAWTLLALSIAIAKGGDMSQAGYIFATVVGLAAFLLGVMKPFLEWLVEYAEVNNITLITNNLFALMICLLFMCAWFTGKLFSTLYFHFIEFIFYFL